jgi:hypothetical protein
MNMMIHLNSSDLITISYYIYNKHKSTLHRNQTTDPELLAKHWFAGHQKALDRQNIGCRDTKRHSTGKTLVPGTPKGTRPAKHWFPGHQKALDLFHSVIILMPVVLISPILFTSVKLHHSKMADTMIRKVFSFSLSIFLGL